MAVKTPSRPLALGQPDAAAAVVALPVNQLPALSDNGFVFGDGSNPTIRLKRRWRRIRWTLLVFACLAVVVGALAVTQPQTSTTPFAPDSTAPQGTRAVAQVLRRQGVQVRQVASVADALAASSANTTLVISPTWLLDAADIDLLVAAPADLVLLDPMPQLARLATDGLVGVAIIGADAAELAASCTVPAASNAGSIWAAANLLWADDHANLAASAASAASAAEAPFCFPTATSTQQVFAFAQLSGPHRTVSVLSDALVVTNEGITASGNAALALWVLGANPEVVWLVVDPLAAAADAPAASPPLLNMLPPWAVPVLLAAAFTLAVLALVQGRRLGPLVVEELPVVVPAIETTQGLGRLYRSGRSRAHAAAALRAGAAARIARRLGLADTANPATLTAAIAHAANRDPADIQRIFYGPSPKSDAELSAQTAALDQLENEVTVL